MYDSTKGGYLRKPGAVIPKLQKLSSNATQAYTSRRLRHQMIDSHYNYDELDSALKNVSLWGFKAEERTAWKTDVMLLTGPLGKYILYDTKSL